MLFNTIDYFIFLPVIFIFYWFANKNLKLQNLLLLVGSYYFYSCWNWHFLFLLIFSTGLDFYSGIKISQSRQNATRKFWLWLSILINLGFLGIFKYYNFFAGSFAHALSQLGFKVDIITLNVILPVGISFYTFHGLSYIIDIYKKRIQCETNFIDYALFVSFFPLLVAGPIERAGHLLPQIKRPRTFEREQAIDGLRQILWGLFKKVAIADQCSNFVNPVFNNSGAYHGSDHVIAAVLFAFQIYCDFSGYSDIAIGSAKLLGIDLIRNFSYPYFSRNIAEFWRRWHISLSTWFRDYLYIPLGGSRVENWQKIRNILIIFIVSGFWHGANWTYIIWGLINALFILPSVLFKTNRNYLEIAGKGRVFPTLKELVAMLSTFCVTVFAWIFFRSDSVSHAISYIAEMFSASIFFMPYLKPKVLFLFIGCFIMMEWYGREQQYAIARLGLNWHRAWRWASYYLMIVIILYLSGPEQQFIYFQF